MYAQEDTENRRFNDNVALSRGIKEFTALAAAQHMRTEALSAIPDAADGTSRFDKPSRQD
jgi:hypothetical protein